MNAPFPGLELLNISHSHSSKTVVKDFSLTVPSGSLTCLLGPSGCGKTTVLRLSAGLERLEVGSIRVDGVHVADKTGGLPPEQRGVGLMFQDYALFPHLDVLRNVSFGLNRLPAESREIAAKEALEQVGMMGAVSAFPHMLSGGEQQRVALARALAPKPKVLLLDEPFSGLDAELRASLRDDTLSLIKKTATTTLMVTHDPMESMLMADHVALMYNGRVVQVGTPTELYRRPQTPFCARFLGDVMEFVGVVRLGEVITPLGRVPAGSAEDGQEVLVLVRPEAVYLGREPGKSEFVAVVNDARVLGPYTKLSITLAQTGEKINVTLSGRNIPSTGSKVAVELDFSMIFVFPVRDR